MTVAAGQEPALLTPTAVAGAGNNGMERRWFARRKSSLQGLNPLP
jgi:hypothetical protein